MTSSLINGLRRLIYERCNNFLLPGSSRVTCIKFIVDGYFVGLIRPDLLPYILAFPNVFVWAENCTNQSDYITFHPSLQTYDERNTAVATAMLDLRASNSVRTLKGWRNEQYGIYVHNRTKTLFTIERAASTLLGITHYGCHINGFFIRDLYNGSHSSSDGSSSPNNIGHGRSHPITPPLCQFDPATIMMWIGVRSANKPTWPGMLDNIAAGGLTHGLDILECARKECQEEANIPQDLLHALKLVSDISYIFEDERGVSPQVEYCFDLELPKDFVPTNSDKEVDHFELVSISQVKELILSDQFKANSALVILDFLFRHKLIDIGSESHFEDLVSMMHVDFGFD